MCNTANVTAPPLLWLAIHPYLITKSSRWYTNHVFSSSTLLCPKSWACDCLNFICLWINENFLVYLAFCLIARCSPDTSMLRDFNVSLILSHYLYFFIYILFVIKKHFYLYHDFRKVYIKKNKLSTSKFNEFFTILLHYYHFYLLYFSKKKFISTYNMTFHTSTWQRTSHTEMD